MSNQVPDRNQGTIGGWGHREVLDHMVRYRHDLEVCLGCMVLLARDSARPSEAAPLARLYYEGRDGSTMAPVGSPESLAVAFGDEDPPDLRDGRLHHCAEVAEREGDAAGYALAHVLLRMTAAGRRRVARAALGL